MALTGKEIGRAVFKAKMTKYLHENNMTLTEFFQHTGFTQNKYHRIAAGCDIYFSGIVQFIACTNGLFTYDELANLIEK